MNRRSFVGIAVAAALASTPALAQRPSPEDGRILIEYVPPKDANLQHIYETVRERHGLEMVQAMLSPFRLPVDLTIRATGCDGDANAFYQRKDGKPTITICYEYLQELMDKMPKETTQAGVTPSDAMVGQFIFAVAHEFGHAAFDMFDVPIMGREEDAADQFAAYFMLRFRDDEAYRLIAGAAYAYHEYIKNYKDNPNVTLQLKAFSSDHGFAEQRFANLMCVSYGADAKLFAVVVERGYLPEARAKRCRYEYLILRHAMRGLIMPHVDQDAAARVVQMQWLRPADAPTPGH
jgi:hypothetical protein